MSPAPTDIYEDPEVRRCLKLYIEFARRRAAWISARTEELYRRNPAFAPMTVNLTGEAMLRQNTENIERIGRAADGGDWGPYLANLSERGRSYAKAGIQFSDWTDIFQRLLGQVIDAILEEGGDAEQVRQTLKGAGYLLDTVVQVIGQTFVETQAEIIRDQQKAILRLATPVLVVADRVLLATLIGDLDESRINQLRGAMLGSIRTARAKVVVLDVTGVATVDTEVAQRLGNCIRAARLMGARVLVSGISPEISVAMGLLGVDLPGAEMYATLQDALAAALEIVQSAARGTG